VEWEKALEIFNELTWTKFTKLAEKTFPKLNELCPDAYGAIVSLVFNRGTSLNGPSRVEMAKIKELIPNKQYKQIAGEIRKMKRLWANKGMDGLLERRESEAKLVETCI
jgi:GH24 family phage-related lysozyme (muramidase)